MKPSLPLSWIGTTLRSCDQGLFHLVAVEDFHGISIARPACGARVHALSGSYPDSGPVPGQKCQRCVAIANKERSK